VACALDASATARRGKTGYFRQQVAYYRALTAKGVDWREQLQNLLEKWAPEFKELTKKKRCSAQEVASLDCVTQVDPRLL
jgi:hypothetical protein